MGYLCNKWKLFDEISDRYFSGFLINIALPASIIGSATGQNPENRMMAFLVLGIACAIFILLPVLGIVFQKSVNCDDTYKVMLTYPNLGFMGFPIVSTLYGQIGLFYASLFMIVFNLSIFSYGISVIKKEKGIQLKKMLTPGIISAVLALIIFVFSFPVPEPISEFLSGIGGITSPLAMVTLGSTLASVQIGNALKNKMLYMFAACKLIVWPIIVYFLLQFFIEDRMILGICTVLTGLPVAGNVSMLCISCHGNKELAAEGTCISTVLSLVTIPVMLLLFQ